LTINLDPCKRFFLNGFWEFRIVAGGYPMGATPNPVFFDILENYHVNGMEEIFI
jgi:hypothetical protein